DGDNDLDVMITGAKENFDAISNLYTNDGNGNFSESIDNSFTGVGQSSIAFADIDGDNDLDLFISGQNISETPAFIAKLYINDGGGTFTEVVGTPFTGVFNSSIAFSDIDGDNDQDLLITGQPSPASFSTTLYTNDGQGNFTEVANSPIADVGFGSIDFADVDGDGDEDLLITGFTEFGNPVSVLYTNDGTGNFEEVMNTPFEDVGFSSIAFADIDNDNDQDVLIAGFGVNTRLYLNDGSGNFSELSDVPFLDVTLGAVALADIDGDTDKDVLISGFSSQGGGQITRLYINEGSLSNTEDRFDLPDFEFVVFPNPVSGSQLQLKIETGQSNLITIGIFDMMGRQISQKRQVFIGENQPISLDIGHMQTGNYIIQIDDGHRRGRRLFCLR
ncbi:MAG: FG-GAP-like repeat-containing protein, partial [Bacteroidota bacterium]